MKLYKEEREKMIDDLAQNQLDEIDDMDAILTLAKERLESLYDYYSDNELVNVHKKQMGHLIEGE